MQACYRNLRRYKYQLVQDYVHELNEPFPDVTTPFISILNNVLTIKKGYCWDGPSGPTWDTLSSMRASLVHDALYQLIRMGMLLPRYREPSDLELQRTGLEDGMWRWRAWAWYKAVSNFAAGAATPGTQEDKIICVGREE